MNNLPSPILYKEEEKLDVRLGFKYNCFIKDDNDLIFHTHDYYELLFLPHEGCTHLVNGITYHLPKGSLIFIRPSDCHDFLNPELKPVQIIHLGISHTIIEKLFDYLSPDFPSDKLLLSHMPPYVILDSFETNELLDSLNKLNSVDVKNKSLKAVVMRATLSTIFMQFFSDRYGRPAHTVATASDYGSPRKITVSCKKTMWRSKYICCCGKYCPITSRPVLIAGIFLIY